MKKVNDTQEFIMELVNDMQVKTCKHYPSSMFFIKDNTIVAQYFWKQKVLCFNYDYFQTLPSFDPGKNKELKKYMVTDEAKTCHGLLSSIMGTHVGHFSPSENMYDNLKIKKGKL